MRTATQVLLAVLVLAAAACTRFESSGPKPDAGTVADTSVTPDPGMPGQDVQYPEIIEIIVFDPGPPKDPGSTDPGVTDGEEPWADAQDLPPVEEVDEASDIPATDLEEGPCIPACDGRVCGPDGCGDICGFCKYGEACTPEGTCKPICFPDCEDRECGSDGCEGSCGDCPENFECGLTDGKCHEKACVADCTGKQCGNDGCGGSCGTCGKMDVCSGDGKCVEGPCKGVDPKYGKCDGKVLQNCVETPAGLALTLIDCGQDPTKTCGWDPWEQKFACVDWVCTPDCTDKECGDDGCGGKECGTCYEGWACPMYKCHPADGAKCGPVPEIGECWDDKKKLYRCVGAKPFDKIVEEDCGAQGKTCQFVPANGQYDCLD